MKRLFLLWLSHKLDRLKVRDQGLYMTIISALGGILYLVNGPEFNQWLQDMAGDKPWLSRTISVLIFIIGGLVSPRTSERSKEYLQRRFIKQRERSGKQL